MSGTLANVKSKYDECLQKWGFREDPFGEKYPYRDFFWARPKGNLEFMEFLLQDAKISKKSMNILIRGDYGSGKTYMLNVLKAYVEKELGGLGLLFQIPSKDAIRGFRDILAQLVQEVDIDRIAETGRKIAKENSYDYGKLRDYLAKDFKNGDAASALCNLVFNVDFALTSTWLSGEANLFQVKALGFKSASRDERTALDIIYDLVNFLGLEYPIIGIFIDELENLVGESGPIRSIREGLRNFYDEIIYNKQRSSIVVFTAATSTIFFEIQASMGAALIDRLDQEVPLQPLNDSESKDFVSLIFDWAREKTELKGKFCPPFASEAALKEFIKLVPTASFLPPSRISGEKGTPRRMLKVGKYLLQKACFKNLESIADEKVKNILMGKE